MDKAKVKMLFIIISLSLLVKLAEGGPSLSNPRGSIPVVGPHPELGLAQLPNGEYLGIPQGAVLGLVALLLVPGVNGKVVRVEEDEYNGDCICCQIKPAISHFLSLVCSLEYKCQMSLILQFTWLLQTAVHLV